jgi:hypothetical protein
MGLITLDKLKSKLGITDTTQDTELQEVIDAITEMIEQITSKKFESTVYTDEKHIGTDTTYLTLRNYPVVSIEKIEIDDLEIDDYELLEKDKKSGRVYREKLWKRYAYENPINNTQNGSVLRSVKNVSVSYTAGYATIPLAVQRITLQECVRAYKGEDMKGNVSSWKLGNASESYKGGDVDDVTGFLMKNYNYLINNYRDTIITD